MTLLKSLRNNYSVNLLGRRFIKGLSRISPSTSNKLSQHWPVAGDVTINFDNIELRMHSECDDGIVHSLYFNREYVEQTDLKLFFKLASHKKTFLDIGANTGVYTIMGKLINQHLKILSFEPHPNNFKRLEYNVNLNALTDVQLFEYAVGSGMTELKFAIPDDERISDVSSADLNFSRSMYKGEISWKDILVKQVTIDHVIEKHCPNGIDLIKIDVENYEVPVFEGGRKSIAQFLPEIICELFLTDEKIMFFNQFVSDCKLRVYTIENKGLTLLEHGFAHNPSGLNFFLTPINYGQSVDEAKFESLLDY